MKFSDNTAVNIILNHQHHSTRGQECCMVEGIAVPMTEYEHAEHVAALIEALPTEPRRQWPQSPCGSPTECAEGHEGVCTTVSLPPTRTAENAELDDDLPTAQSYVIEYAWACDCCNEVNGTEDIDTSGSVQICDFCGQRTRVTT